MAGMDLLDLVEMVCDWMAAAEREPEDGVKRAYNVRLFGVEPQPASVFATHAGAVAARSGAPCQTETPRAQGRLRRRAAAPA